MKASEFSALIKKTTHPLPGSIPAVKTYRLTVKKRYEGMQLLDFYARAMPSISRDVWKQKIESGNLTLAGKTAKIETLVRAGEITQHTSAPMVEPPINANIALLSWNDDFIVLNKPAPLPVHAGGRFEKNSLIEILQQTFPKESFKLVHRIDANTTGLLVIARNKSSATQLIDQFKDQSVQKEYLALTEGIISRNYFVLKDKISKKLMTSGSRKISENGKIAHTEFKVLEKFSNKNQSLITVTPHSGRTNQIRIHLAGLGHPIVGDAGYKDPEYFKNNPLTYAKDCLYLHAWKLTFSFNKQLLTFIAPIPHKFKDYPINNKSF